ncbi:hypothetical protein B0J14DRAFT_649592 [Halenospora varia]|nr:hypothetical protein B0J14DRAFT_649592 [Halenospora varia]
MDSWKPTKRVSLDPSATRTARPSRETTAREAREKKEKEARERAAKEAREKATPEARAKAAQEAREKAARELREKEAKAAGEKAFKDAQRKFLESISESEKAQFESCSSAEELLKMVEGFGDFIKRHSHWSKTLGRIKRFSDGLQPYFNIIGTVLSSHPEFAAIAWGSFLLVLKLASNFTSFFEKLTEILERLCTVLPNYNDIAGIIKDKVSGRFQESLRNLYLDVFEFFRAIARLFTQKDGSLKRTPVVISQLLWRPFDARFTNFSKRLTFHDEVLQNEISTFSIQTQVSTAENLKAQTEQYYELLKQLESQSFNLRPDTVCADIKRWLDPPSLMEERDASQSIRNPGAGKTILAAAVAEQLEKEIQVNNDDGYVFCSYFFSYTTPDKKANSTAYRSILAQVLDQCQKHTAMIDAFLLVKSTMKPGCDKASNDDLLRLLSMVPHRLQKVYIILDGIDESEDPDTLVEALATAFEDLNVKLLLFSRPNIHVLRKATSLHTITIRRELVEPDLTMYFSRHIGHLIDEKLLPASSTCPDIVNHLLSGADGMFMWARLMISFLKSPALVPASRLAVIQSLSSPERIDEMYIRILRLLSGKTKPERNLAQSVFLWLSYQRATLFPPEFQDAITPLNDNAPPTALPEHKRTVADEFVDFEHTLIMACGSLVELRNGSYQFVHQSVHEFFRTWTISSFDELSPEDMRVCQQFLMIRLEAESSLATTCLSYLLYRAPAQPLSGDMRLVADATLVHEAFPFLSYASLNWTHHLESSIAQLEEPLPSEYKPYQSQYNSLLRCLSRFLSNNLVLMAWIELSYTFQDLERQPMAHFKIRKWVQWIKEFVLEDLSRNFRNVPSTLSEFVDDLSTINDLWGPTLVSAPHKIWVDVTGFTKSKFLIQTAAITVSSMPATPFESDKFELSSKPLCTTSIDTESGELVGVLSIWPSKSFQSIWSNLNFQRPFTDISELAAFDGWIARFETWSIVKDDPVRIRDFCFHLDREDVAQQVKSFLGRVKKPKGSESFEPGGFSQLILPFPTAISTDLSTVMILKRAYFLNSRNNEADPFDSTLIKSVPSILVQRRTYNSTLGSDVSPTPELEDHDHQEYIPSRRCTSYSYRFHIHKFGKYVLFEDDLRVNLPRHVKPTVSSIVVFKLDFEQLIPSCTYLRTFGGTSTYNCLSMCSFHPTLPLILLFSKSYYHSSSIILWLFTEAYRTSTLFRTTSGIDHLEFSSCGTQIVAKITGTRHTQVISIEENVLHNAATEAERLERKRRIQSFHGSNNNHKRSKSDRSYNEIEKTATGSFTALFFPNSKAHEVHLSSGGSQREVQITNYFDYSQETQQVVSLPSWRGIDNVGVGIHQSNTREEKLKIILNKTMQPWYNLSDPVDENLPAFVQKDKSVLEAPRSSHKRDVRGMILER